MDSDRCNFNSDSLLVNEETMEAGEADEAGGAGKMEEVGEEGEEDSLGSLFTVKAVKNSDSIHVYMVAQVRLGKKRGGREGLRAFNNIARWCDVVYVFEYDVVLCCVCRVCRV